VPNWEIRLRTGERRVINGERVDIQDPLTENGYRSVVVLRGAVVMARFKAEDVDGWDEAWDEAPA
jgi:hypothetical protein